MGSGSFRTVDYDDAVHRLQSTGTTFARSATAQRTGNLHDIAEILDPRKLKNGMRESCFTPGFNDATPIFVGIDGTGSMEVVPHHLQKELPKLIDLLTEKGISDHPNVLFVCHDDERACPPDAVFQMSQFEIESAKLIEALNEMIIPGNGGGNRGEAYHLVFYAAANHTRLESFERDGAKGFLFLICDEEPYYEAGDPSKQGTTPEIAKEVFGDTIEAEVTMLESAKKAFERFHIFVIRPGHTQNGQNKAITKLWQKLFKDVGENPEHVLEIGETEAIVSTMALAIGRLAGADQDELVEVLKSKGAGGISAAVDATSAIVPYAGGNLVAAKASGSLATTDSGSSGRARR